MGHGECEGDRGAVAVARGGRGSRPPVQNVMDLAARRRREPAGALLDALLAAEADGERSSEVELVNTLLSVLVGGHESVRKFLTIATR